MYFVISVFPISMTAGVLPPAIVASNFWRCVPHVWYCTSTPTSGWAFSNCALAAATIGAQLAACASVCSQTVMLFAAARWGAETDAAAEAAIASVAASTPTAMVRPFMNIPPKTPDGRPPPPARRSAPRLAYTTWSRPRDLHISPSLVKTSRRNWYLPRAGVAVPHGGQHRHAGGRGLRPAELGHEPEAVAAVDRPHVLDDPPVLGARDPLEEEGRRVERDAKRVGFVLVRHRRLDRLD